MPYTIIRGGRVLDIDKGTAAPEDATVVSADRKLIHPGIVNAHTHAHGNLAKGMGDRWTLELLLTAAAWRTRHRTQDDIHLTAQLGAVEMVLKGCTAAYDLFVEFPLPTRDGIGLVASAYQEVGMRAVVAPMIADRTFFEAIPGLMDALPDALQERVKALRLAPGEATLAAARAALADWSFDRGRVRPAIAPTIPHHCSDEFIRGCAALSRDFGVGLHSHVAESKVQALAGMRLYGKTLTAHLDELGILGPDFTVAHGVWLDNDDMKRLGDRGASIAHNPGSNMRLGAGLADSRAMLDAGVNLGIGTDGANCSDNQNMYEAMRLASFVSKAHGPDWQRWLSTREVALAATEGSAHVLGFGDHIGRIAP